jgi:hypothetical protein
MGNQIVIPSGEALNVPTHRYATHINAGVGEWSQSPRVQFQNYSCSEQEMAGLTSTYAIGTYRENVGGSETNGYCYVATRSGDTITTSTPIKFNTVNTQEHAIVRMSDTHALIAWGDIGGTDQGTAKCVDIDGSGVPTVNAAHIFQASRVTNADLSSINSSSAVFSFRNTGGSGEGRVSHLTLTGTTVSSGASVQFATSAARTAVTMLDSQVGLVAYWNVTSGDFVIKSFTDIGGSFTFYDTETITSSGDTSPGIGLRRLTDTTALLTYSDTSNVLTAKVVTVSATPFNITLGSALSIPLKGVPDPHLVVLSSTEAFVWGYEDIEVSPSTQYVQLDISGTTATTSETVPSDGLFSGLAGSRMDDDTLIVGYRNTEDGPEDGVARLVYR